MTKGQAHRDRSSDGKVGEETSSLPLFYIFFNILPPKLAHMVYVGGVDVNAERVKQGAAWVYRQFLKDQSLLTLEAEAAHVGKRMKPQERGWRKIH
jgi:hypothetical protein